ncbi:MAG: histidine--tRNA ligase [Rhodospirillales bacterium]|jgi:histidyl-tRNA synthetase|nr:histidine--tRNA ligase [Rhodospirillales bacterium]
MASLKPVRGTHDLLDDDILRHRHVEQTAFAVASRYGYSEIVTPIFESTEVFARTLGDTSDIVTKEMYTFEDKGKERITLRPEGTAGVARAFISGGLAQKLPLKLFYRGPMFRYERPQKGRQRQFNQIGAELLGVPGAQADVEIIALGAQILDELGLSEHVVCELNSLGDAESRNAYRTRLVEYLEGQNLSEDSRERLHRNPLRILDSKDEKDKAIVADAPLMSDSLNDESRRFFDDLLNGLEIAGVKYTLNPRMVRGLDYYCHSAFEFTTTALGAQGTVLGGGRYDGLVKQMGGPATPGIGWAAGVERLAMLVEGGLEKERPVVIIPVGAEAADTALAITQQLRRAGFAVDLGFSGNLGKRMKRANAANACATVILGEDEIARQAATVRDMDSGEQAEVPLTALETHLDRFR